MPRFAIHDFGCHALLLHLLAEQAHLDHLVAYLCRPDSGMLNLGRINLHCQDSRHLIAIAPEKQLSQKAKQTKWGIPINRGKNENCWMQVR